MPSTQTYRLVITTRNTQQSAAGANIVTAAHQLGLTGLQSCRTRRLFFIHGTLSPTDAQNLANQLLTDPVTESCDITSVNPADTPTMLPGSVLIDVTLLPGVTDPAAENLIKTAHKLGYHGLTQAASGQRYLLKGNLELQQWPQLASTILANPVIQRFSLNRPITPPFIPSADPQLIIETIPLRQADDTTLDQISQERRLALDTNEMRTIRDYFQKEDRDPTDAELEMLAQTWSEHCVHKTFRANITYTDPDGTQTIDGLLKQYIRAATDKVNKPWVRSAFVDNAGIVAFTDDHDLAFKVETHNHPSALEPFGGANTGVGGVVRDVIGVSARPIANTNILCFGPPDLGQDQLPAGVLHPRRIADGVIHGIEDYGNKMGIPTVNGAILYDQGYTANPLVYCGCLGLLPTGSHPTGAQAGDYIVGVGGRTGRDGIRGATFSSMEMDTSTSDIAGSSVQIGHPIQEKQVQEVILRARDEKLYSAITDCGAGGFSSAVGEMAEGLGAIVHLDRAPLKYPGLQPWEIWLSEAQERMVLSIPPQNWDRLQEIAAGQDVELVNLGTFQDSGRLQLFYNDETVGDIDIHFLHDGIPQRQLTAEWHPPPPPQTHPPPPPPTPTPTPPENKPPPPH
ncbi:MAG TPA: phosphoribosylformylglycinamidine synthase subunit PurS, partial [Anaerolineae bacterium]|nr:phosphoribosylformylglycinamidine synthase subunit PurS [Anaerolineae bacterium]